MWNFIYKEMKKYRDSIVFDEMEQYSYAEIINLVREKSSYLNQLPQKSKCGILCEKGINCAISILACWQANLIPIVMSLDYGKKHWEKIIELTEPDVIIKDNAQRQIYRYEFLVKESKYIGKKLDTKYDDNLKDIALIMCTSGTTGIPKGVLIRTEGLKKNILAISKYFIIGYEDKILIARPLYHCAVLTGEFLIGLFKGCNIGFLDERYQPIKVINFCVNKKISVLCGTPTLFNHLSIIIQRNNIKHEIKKIALSGECLSEKIAHNIRNGFKKAAIYSVYGLTEASPRVSYLLPEKFDEYPESVGIPINSVKLKIIDEKGKKLSPFKKGEILVKTPCIMKEYYHNKKGTSAVFMNGWLVTGDIGYLDNNGYLYILSRKDDMIIKGGMNIYPKEIESQVIEIEQVKECVAYAINNDNFQEIAIDIVIEDEFSNISKKEILNLLLKNLPTFQIPSKINVVKELERNASGKVIRKSSVKELLKVNE